MNKIPERIWLQVYGEDWWGNESPELPTDNEDVTWCVDQINGSDVEYVLASKYEELEAVCHKALEKAFLRIKELEADLKDILDNTPDTESFAKAYRALSSNDNA